MTADRRSRSTRGSCSARGRCGHQGRLLASMRMPMMMMPVVACGCGRCRAEQVIQDVNDGTNVPLRPTVSILEGWVQSAAKRAGIHAFAMMMHTLYYCALPASCVLLNLKRYVRFYILRSIYWYVFSCLVFMHDDVQNTFLIKCFEKKKIYISL